MLGQCRFSGFYVALIGTVGRISPWLGFRLHQARKLALMPLESYERHVPHEIVSGHPEVLVAIARKSSD